MKKLLVVLSVLVFVGAFSLSAQSVPQKKTQTVAVEKGKKATKSAATIDPTAAKASCCEAGAGEAKACCATAATCKEAAACKGEATKETEKTKKK